VVTSNVVSETQVLRTAETQIGRALPAGWSVRLESGLGHTGSARDVRLHLSAPGGEAAEFAVQVGRSPTARALLSAVENLARRIAEGDGSSLPLIVAGYLSPRAKQVLDERGVSYVDTTGNLRLSATRPGLFIERSGATKDPSPDDQPLRSLRGRGAGRAMRALIDFSPPYGVRELATRAQLSPATLARVIDLLERDAVLARDERGGVADLDWASAIRRWSQDYELRRSNAVASYLDPRGLNALSEALTSTRLRYAVTTSLAAQRFAPIAATRTAVIYVDDSFAAAGQLKLSPADAGANVLLVEPYDEVAFERTTTRDGLVIAAPSQVAVDLLTGPGREPSEGEELLNWMKVNEDDWRA
jgi:hypothetical protein